MGTDGRLLRYQNSGDAQVIQNPGAIVVTDCCLLFSVFVLVWTAAGFTLVFAAVAALAFLKD